MAPRLKLPENFRVKTFGSSRNVNGVGKYLVSNAPLSKDGGVGAEVEVEITHVTETRFSLHSNPVALAGSDMTVVSPIIDLGSDGDGQPFAKRPAEAATTGRKRTKTAPGTITRRWQEVWACKFAWAEGEFNTDGDITGVICRSCTSISGRQKLLVPKVDNLEKHEDKRVCREDGVPFAHLKKGDIFVKSDCQHLQFVKLWEGQKRATVADQLQGGLEGEYKWKHVQFCTLLHILAHGRPMCDYKRQEKLLKQLKVRNLSRKHWSETSVWEMSEHIHLSVLCTLKSVVQSASFISLSADEVTAVDGTSWLGVHVYVVSSWERIPHLLLLSCASESGTADHLTDLIMHGLLNEGGLTREEIAKKLICFGADGVSTFQGPKTGVTTQIREKWAPFLIGASCVSHCLNLVVETMSKFPMVSRLESLFQSIYSYFCRSNKRHAQLHRLADLMETKGNKMLRNVETRWISMRSPAARILSEYRTLLVKIGADMTSVPGSKLVPGAFDNFDLLSDIELLLSLACFIPLVNAVHSLIKLSQARDIFVGDFMQALKLCQAELSWMFVEASTAFNKVDFPCYCDLVSLSSSDIPLLWRPLAGDSGICHLLFNFQHVQMFARCHDKQSGAHFFVTQEQYNRVQENVEQQFLEIAQSLIAELDRRFLQQALQDAFGIIYPQYWRHDGAEEFQPSFGDPKGIFCNSKGYK